MKKWKKQVEPKPAEAAPVVAPPAPKVLKPAEDGRPPSYLQWLTARKEKQ